MEYPVGTGRILLLNGHVMDVMNPEADDFDLEDIAQALSQEARFGGRCREFYSVAQHSYYMSYMTPPEKAKQYLLHDGVEAYMRDMASPWKPLMPEYKAHEKRLAGHLALSFGMAVDAFEDPGMKLIDRKIQALEAATLLDDPSPVFAWCGTPDGSMFDIDKDFQAWDWKTAKRLFINRFHEIKDAGF